MAIQVGEVFCFRQICFIFASAFGFYRSILFIVWFSGVFYAFFFSVFYIRLIFLLFFFFPRKGHLSTSPINAGQLNEDSRAIQEGAVHSPPLDLVHHQHHHHPLHNQLHFEEHSSPYQASPDHAVIGVITSTSPSRPEMNPSLSPPPPPPPHSRVVQNGISVSSSPHLSPNGRNARIELENGGQTNEHDGGEKRRRQRHYFRRCAVAPTFTFLY